MYRILFYEPKKEYHKLLYNIFLDLEKIYDVKLTVIIIADLTEFFVFLENTSNYPDILYTNNFENGESSVDFVVSIRQTGFHGEVIFIGKDINEVYKTFDAFPTTFILEDEVSKRTIQHGFWLALKKIKYRVSDSFFVKIRGRSISVSYNDVVFLKSDKRTITIHSLDGSTLSFYGSFKDFLNESNYKGFLRIHKSYIINHAYIRQISAKEVVLVGDIKIPIGISYYQNIKDDLLVTAKIES
ncbi:LytTR family transcriptional regulator [Acholeplasma sp. OttesenSCG-928-E16]|nr:LytTR family transcriptional regulator [Acholeplasma sp. OttesenSCG-928-E16]